MPNLRLEIDIGSTTAKVVILNGGGDLLFSSYCRHNAETVMYYFTIIREIHKGEAQRVVERYLRDYTEGKIPTEKKSLLAALESAVADFNAIEVDDKVYPKAGIVGEIYVKYNPLSNNNAAQWLIEQDVEVVMPIFLEFFAGEVASFAKNGINNVLCLQPFGCIANHIIAKGAEKKMKEMYPQLNLLFLDADAGVSEVNFFNRMHFFVNHAKTAIEMAMA
jgi:predicted nucleotide-binding protein (sugar kinase/HSP70/actin superfamily)